MTTKVKFAKVKPEAKIPSKRVEDMGFDIYACFEEDYICILPHETKLIPTGIASVCDPSYGFFVVERGSTGSKGIARRCGAIDSGYRNEWFIGLTNTTNNLLYISKLEKEELFDTVYHAKTDVIFKDFLNEFNNATIYPYSKAIAQTLVLPIPEVEVEEISYEDLKVIPSERGLGCLGSSNK